MNRELYTVASLFTGCGGMDLGFIKAGFKVLWAHDINKDCCATYHQNIGSHIVCMNIKDVNTQDIPDTDVIIGGPPCQGFSIAGKMRRSDPRNQLLWNFVDIVSNKKPKIFVMENVKALGYMRRWGLVRKRLISKFEKAGYNVTFKVLNSADYGVPQMRERVFFIGVLEGVGEPSFPEPKYIEKRISAREVLADLPNQGEEGNEGVCSTKIVIPGKPVIRRSPYAGMLFNGQGRVIDLDSPAPTLHASMGGNKTPIVDLHQLKALDREPWIEGYHKRLINGEQVENCIVPEHLRRITVREAARLQTFPDDFSFTGKITSKFRQIGNAVPPALSYHIACEVKAILRKHNS